MILCGHESSAVEYPRDGIGERVILERDANRNRFAILPHRPTYVMVTYSKRSQEPYADRLQGYEFSDAELKFQISIKYLAVEDMFAEDLDLQMAFTSVSWWQAFSSNISAPFRETNYEPELILNFSRAWSFLGLPVRSSVLSLNHQSNGQAGDLSRSWNRIIAGMAFEQGDFVWSTQFWWRFPEEEKDGPNDVQGDDNPNIEQYLGYGTLSGVWRSPRGQSLELSLRNNLDADENRSSLEIGWSFPLTERLRGYVQYVNGYGDGLIYYRERQESVGLGVKLTDWL